MLGAGGVNIETTVMEKSCENDAMIIHIIKLDITIFLQYLEKFYSFLIFYSYFACLQDWNRLQNMSNS